MEYGTYNGDYQPYPNAEGSTQDKVKQHAAGIFSQIVELLKSPVEQGKEFVFAENTLAAVVLILIQGIASGLFAIVMCAKVQGLFDKVIGMLSGSSSASEIMQMKTMLKMPIMKAFIVTLIVSVVLTFILVALMMIFNAVTGSQMNFIQIISLVSLRSIVAAIMVLLGCIISFVNLYAGIAVFGMGNIAGFMLIATVWSHSCEETADKQIYMMMIMYIIFMIVYVLTVRICWKMYLPDVFKIALSQVESELKTLGSPDKILKEIISSL